MSDSKHHTYGEFPCPWPECSHTSTTRQGLGKHFKPTHGTTLRDYERQHNDGEFPCPTCKDVFDTDRGVKVHHARAHGDSIAGVEVDCSHCGTTITRQPSRLEYYDTHHCEDCQEKEIRDVVTVACGYCGADVTRERHYIERHENVFCRDLECYGDWLSENNTGPNHPRWQDDVPRTVPCSNCGDVLNRRPERILDRSEHFFCDHGLNSCEQEWKQENTPTGPDHHLYSKTEVECVQCGEAVRRKRHYIELVDNIFCIDSECYAEWMAENLRGENNPNYAHGGASNYGPGWNLQKKEQVRERDGRKCVHCERPEQAHVELFGMRHPVHHIRKAHTFDDPLKRNSVDNLVTLCADGCHQKWERMSPLRPDTADLPGAD